MKELESSRVLVTGGAGFLGSWVCEALLQTGAEVTCLDTLATGLKQNVDHLLRSEKFRFLEGNVENFNFNEKFDYIAHLASRASPEEYQEHPVETLRVNSVGTLNMLELARKHDAAFMFSSSSEVYGDSTVVPTPESYWGNVNPVGIRSSYDEGKRFSEAACMAYLRKYGLDVRVPRIFNTYGERLRPDGLYGRALPRFVMQALQNRDITVYGDGQQTRSFCYASDMCDGLIKMLTAKKGKGLVVNLGNPVETTILELANTVVRMTESKSKVVFTERGEDDPERRCPDITLAKETLGWQPKITLEEGLRRTIPWIKRFLDAETVGK